MGILSLHNAIAIVCPIEGVSVGSVADRSTWRIDYAPEATLEQKAAAANVLASFDLAGDIAAEDQQAMLREADADYRDIIDRLHATTPVQIKQYVQNNVTDLASAKVLLAKILLLLTRL